MSLVDPGLADKVVLITGGSSGIGLATAELLGACGVRTILVARSFPTDDESNASSHRITADVGVERDVLRVRTELLNRYRVIDGIFVNAGIAEFRPLADADEDHFDRVMDTNVKGAFWTVKHCASLLRPGGSIVFNSSVSAKLGAPWCSVYAASKGAVEALARSFAAELLENRIRVNCVSPGPTQTPILAKAAVPEAGTAKLAPFVFQRMRMGRLGQPSEIAEAVAFLLSDRASFITAQTLAVDGGMSGI